MGDKAPKNTDKRLQNLRPPWKKGESGNPKGRAKSIKNLINENFLRDLLSSWEVNGVTALQSLAEKDQASYVRVVAALMPKEITVNEGEVSIERLLEQYDPEQIDKLDAELGALIASKGNIKDKDKKGAAKRPDSIH